MTTNGPEALQPTIQTDVPRSNGQSYAVVIRDPRRGKRWLFYEVAGLVEQLEQRQMMVEALRRIVWLADADVPESVEAARIATEALEAAGDTGY